MLDFWGRLRLRLDCVMTECTSKCITGTLAARVVAQGHSDPRSVPQPCPELREATGTWVLGAEGTALRSPQEALALWAAWRHP